MSNFKGDLPSQSLDWWNLTCFEPLLYTVESTVSSNDSFRQCTAAYSCKNNNQLTQYLSDTLCANMHKTQSNFPLTIAGLHTGLKMERSGSNNAKQRQTCRKYQSLSPLKNDKMPSCASLVQIKCIQSLFYLCMEDKRTDRHNWHTVGRCDASDNTINTAVIIQWCQRCYQFSVHVSTTLRRTQSMKKVRQNSLLPSCTNSDSSSTYSYSTVPAPF